MARRYYLAPVIGTGTVGDPYRLKIGNYVLSEGDRHVAFIPSKADGTPRFNWGLCVLDAADQTSALNDNQMFALPDKLLDQTITNREANAINTKLAQLGVTVTVSAGDTVRSILLRVGQWMDNNFDVLSDAL